MTPAVTAIALIRFARVDRSTSTGIGYAPEKKTDAAWDMLNCVDEWAIDFHFDGRWLWSSDRCCPHHHYCGGGGRFSSFFVQGNEGLVKDIGDVEIIIRLARRHLIEIRAALRNIECAFHSKRLKFFRERNRRRFELCAFCQNVRGELRFQCTQTIYLVGKKNKTLEIVASIRKADGGKALALGITKSCRLPHHRKIDRRAAANMEWFRLCCFLGKWIRPRCFEIKRVRQDEPRQFIQCVRRYEIMNLVARLVCHPLVDVLCRCRGISNEIERLKFSAVVLFYQRQKILTKIVVFLSKETVGDV